MPSLRLEWPGPSRRMMPLPVGHGTGHRMVTGTTGLALFITAIGWVAVGVASAQHDPSLTNPKADAKPAKADAKPAKAKTPNKLASGRDDPQIAAQQMFNPLGLKLQLWAAEPDVLNPVALWVDHRGRVFVAETHRWKSSTFDIRSYKSWWPDDLACRTVADRDAMHRKWMGSAADKLRESEIVRLLEDPQGVGRATRSTVFAEGFDTLSDGLASGILVKGDDVYLTAIPNLWRLRDTTGDGRADQREVLHYGYGVHMNFLGHDLHGLILGPDGKLYFSCGDRGLHIDAKNNPDGRTVSCPDTGAILRCNPDGTGLEILHIGLRNPQELAFDEYGNLFTCDNNCDYGDKARWVYIAEGGDSGWRVGFQRLGKSAPWMTERLWELDPDLAAYRIAPLAHVSHGPSGLAYNPGVTGLPAKYQGYFLLCNCPGNVLAFTNKPKGAGWELQDVHTFVGKDFWVSDVAFGPDGWVYFTDWVGAWEKNNKGRIWRFADQAALADPSVAEVAALLRAGTADVAATDLLARLGHADMRVRQAAQFALAQRATGPNLAVIVKALSEVAGRAGAGTRARLHALWALGQIAATPNTPDVLAPLVALLGDTDQNVRAQAAWVLGNRAYAPAREALTRCLGDIAPRVVYQAAIALGKLGDKSSGPAIVHMLTANSDRDPLLRHAGVFALAGLGDLDALGRALGDANRSVRMAAVLALRKLQRPEIAAALRDSDPAIVYEAVRAIHDEPIPAAMAALAALADRPNLDDRWVNRIVSANLYLGTVESAAGLARLASRADLSDAARVEALSALADWVKPSELDRVNGLWRPVPNSGATRPQQPAREAFQLALTRMGAAASETWRVAAAKSATALGMTADAAGDLTALITDTKVSAGIRVEALASLASANDAPDTLAKLLPALLDDPADTVRAAAVRLFARLETPKAIAKLTALASSNKTPVMVRQAAITALGELELTPADAVLADLVASLAAGQLPASLHLETLEAAQRRDNPAVKAALAKLDTARRAKPDDDLADYRACLEGGDPTAGRRAFYENASLGCFKCHAVAGEGGVVGPELTTIGKTKSREYLLESIVHPSKVIAEGYQQLVVLTEDDITETGRVERETDSEVVLIRADATRVTLPKAAIVARKAGPSAMPADIIKSLSHRELRDLVEYLAGLREAPTTPTRAK